MNKYKKTFCAMLMSTLGFTSLALAATPTGIKIDEVNFDQDNKTLIVTVCNWDRNDKDMGDYQLQVSNGSKRVTRTFTKGYIVNYACSKSSFTPEELEIQKTESFDIRVRLETTTGKVRDEKNSLLFVELEERFQVPVDPLVDLVIDSLTFDEATKTINAKICNQGENYKISPKYGISTRFAYNNNQAKKIFQEKQLRAGQCWDHSMNLKQLKIVKPGTYRVEAVADSGNALEEKGSNKYDTSKEDNNRETIEVTIEKPVTPVLPAKRTTKKVQKKSSMTLRERIAAMRGVKKSTTTKTTTRRKPSIRRSRNYKSKRSSSKLKSKYPYLFR